MPNLLIFIPSPRDLPAFAEAVATLPHDRYWVKYKPYAEHPYEQARDFFLKHKKYTHLAICPDDLIVTAEGVAKLWQRVQDERLDCLMGTCNVEIADHTNPVDGRLAMTHNLPDREKPTRIYHFYTKKEIDGSVMQPGWCGTPFAILSRKAVEKTSFAGDENFNGGENCGAYDVILCHELKAAGIPLLVDTSVYFYHQRYGAPIQAGLVPPDYWYEHDGVRESDPERPAKILQRSLDEYMRYGGLSNMAGNELLKLLVAAVTALSSKNQKKAGSG